MTVKIKRQYFCGALTNAVQTNSNVTRAVARALIGGLNIHIFVLCPTNFF